MDEMCDCCKPEKVIVLIMTDGQENASEFTLSDVKTRIEKYKKEGWEFVFLGADIDAFAGGTRLGVSGNSCSVMSKGCGGIGKGFAYANYIVSQTVSGQSINYCSNTNDFEDKDFENNVQQNKK